jgi:hypothetical protein
MRSNLAPLAMEKIEKTDNILVWCRGVLKYAPTALSKCLRRAEIYLFPKLITILSTAILFSCGIIHNEKPINPRLMFSVGSSFLDNAKTLALKGRIEFFDGRATQSGSFQMFFNGPDSMSFLIEGPLGVDVFRMVNINNESYLLSNNNDGWVLIPQGEAASIADFGIENISPHLAGIFAFPQYYLPYLKDDSTLGEQIFTYNDNILVVSTQHESTNHFGILEPETGIAAAYSKRRDIDGGFYPSRVTLLQPDEPWRLTFNITKVKVNPLIDPRIWNRD